MPAPAKNNSLNDIIDYFARFVHLYQNAPLRIHDDLLIETAAGCFRIGYTPKRQCTALFYARHPDDLAVCDNDGRLEFAHPERVYFVGSHKIHKPVEEKPGQKLRFDIGWVLPLIHQVVYSLPRTSIREASLFELENSFRSEYLTYETLQTEVKDVSRVNVYTNPHMTYDLAAIEPAPLEGADKSHRSFRRAALNFYHRATSSHFPLYVEKEVDGEKPRKIDLFDQKNIFKVILSDFHGRAFLIWNGRHPVTWKEKHTLPLFHATANLRLEYKRLIQHLKDPENAARFGLNWGAAGAISMLFHMAGYNALIRRVTEFGRLPTHVRVCPELFPLVRRHLRRLATMHSDLNGLLLRPDPCEFKDFEALNDAKHECSFVPAGTARIGRDERREFGSWLKRHFVAPYAAGFRLYGPLNAITDTAHFEDAVMIQQEISNGLKIFVLPKTMEMFAYFQNDGFEVKNRKFPFGADHYLKAGTVLRLDLKDMNDAFTEMPFAAFGKKIRELTRATALELPDAQNLPPDRVNPKLLYHARGDCTVRDHGVVLPQFLLDR